MKYHQPSARVAAKREEGRAGCGPGAVTVFLPHSTTVPVMRKLVALMLGVDAVTTVDVFLITCKVKLGIRSRYRLLFHSKFWTFYDAVSVLNKGADNGKPLAIR